MEQITNFFNELGAYNMEYPVLFDIFSLIGLVVLAYLANFIAKKVILRSVHHFASRTSTHWDDLLVERGVFRRLSHFTPAIVIYIMAPIVFNNETAVLVTKKIAQIYMLLVSAFTVDAFLSAIIDIYRSYSVSQKMPIKSMIQVVKIFIYLVIGVVILSIIIGRSPAFFIGGIGAMTAVLMLIFKDPILGFAAGYNSLLITWCVLGTG